MVFNSSLAICSLSVPLYICITEKDFGVNLVKPARDTKETLRIRKVLSHTQCEP